MAYSTDVEEGMGIEPLEPLLEERLRLVDKSAALAAQYGTWGTWEHTRKAELSRIKMLLRAKAADAETKVTESWLDDAAHNHEDYTSLLALATSQKAIWLRVDARITAIDNRIMRGQAIARFVSAEVGHR